MPIDAKNKATFAISSGCPILCTGIEDLIFLGEILTINDHHYPYTPLNRNHVFCSIIVEIIEVYHSNPVESLCYG
jgi:hypothetical protein